VCVCVCVCVCVHGVCVRVCVCKNLHNLTEAIPYLHLTVLAESVQHISDRGVQVSARV